MYTVLNDLKSCEKIFLITLMVFEIDNQYLTLKMDDRPV